MDDTGEEGEQVSNNITENLNAIYDHIKAEIDPIIIQMASISLPNDNWQKDDETQVGRV